MSLSALAVRRPIGTAIVFLAVLVLGVVALGRIPVDLMPSVDFPRITVLTRYEGVAPMEMETLITRPVEQTISTISNVEEITASSSEGLSRVQLRFAWGTDLEEAVNDVRSQLDRLRAALPEDADTPVIYKFDLSAFPVANLGLSGSGDPRLLRYLADETLSRRLERVPGVASVQARGGREREIQVRLDATRLAALDISLDDVVTALARENRNVSGGELLDRGREVIIRTVGEHERVEDMAREVVAWRGERPVLLSDLGEVVDTYADIRSEIWVDGEPGIRLRVAKQDGANTVAVVDALKKEVDAINAEQEGQLALSVLMDSAQFIRASISAVTWSALAGSLLAILVLAAFLRNLRATVVVALTIPISVLATFVLMDAFAISMNVISFGGLTLGIGMLVDNSIVILENIHHRRERGQGPLEAAIQGSQEVATAITAATLTTLAVFAPVIFISGFAGIFFKEMAVVVSFALACSLLVALTLVPSLSARLLGQQLLPEGAGLGARLARRSEESFLALEGAYKWLLDLALGRPWRTLGLASLLLVGAILASQALSYELMPEADEGEVNVSVELPVGTPIETTMEVMQEVEEMSRDAIPEEHLLHLVTVAGPMAWWRSGGSNQGSMNIKLTPRSTGRPDLEVLVPKLQQELGAVPGARVQVRKGSGHFLLRLMRGGGDDRLSVEIRGHDLAVADELGALVEELTADVPGVTFARVDREEGQIEQMIRVDRERAMALGLTGSSVATAVETAIMGRVATRFRDGAGEYPVRVRLAEGQRRHLEQLASLPLVTPRGDVVHLSQVASLEQGMAPLSISRLNQERILRVNVGVGGRALGDVADDIEARLKGLAVPDDFQVLMGGEHREQQDTFAGLWIGLILALFLVYSVMAVQFESLRNPLVVMVSVPFAYTGMVAALLLTGTTMNMNSFLGGIVLVGIVVNNAIILVDTTGRMRSDGLPPGEAVRRAAVRRLRPILMTSLTTSLAMLPLALGLGEGSELQAPLARVVIGGLLVSSLVTLVVVPTVYLLAWGRKGTTGSADGGAVSVEAQPAR